MEISSGSTSAHQRLVDAILLRVGSHPDYRVWKQITGATQVDGRWIRFGLVGAADITGIGPEGKRIEIEVKTGIARQTKEQIFFEKMILKMGGIYILARSVVEVETALRI